MSEPVAGQPGVEQFARVLSHELRTPIASLSALAQALDRDRLSEQHRREALALVLDHVRHLEATIDDVRELAESLSGGRRRQPVHPTDVWLPDLVRAANAAAGLAACDADVSIAADTALVQVDATKLRRILTNLLENARLHGQPRPRLACVLERSDRWLRAIVSDGPVPPIEAARGEASRAEAARELDLTRVEPDTGLGLWIVGSLLISMGGRGRLTQWPGVGTRAVVEVPITSGAGHGSRRGPAGPARSRRAPG